MTPCDFDLARLGDLSDRVVFFPVRHHSPAAARLVRRLARRLRPAAVLIECPADFDDRLAELYLPHQPPLAIYSYVRLADGSRRGAFYPLCEHSPEWQALHAGREVEARVHLIDLPWADIAAGDDEEPANRFSDAVFRRSEYIRQLCRKVGVDDFDSLWDTLFEVDPDLDVAGYLERCHHLCGHMRLLEGAGRLSDRQREAFMAQRIREVLAEVAGQLLVVVGGAHCLPLYARLNGLDLGEMVQPARHQPVPPAPGEERGIALTPYSFERLDNLAGYEAGMPSPGFYHQAWLDRQAGQGSTHQALLARIVARLRDGKQMVSAADLIAVETTAQALAALRGHPCVWRGDLVDALVAALVKEELDRAGQHPLLLAIQAELRGGQRGILAAGTVLPPLVLDIKARIAEQRLEADPVPRTVELELDRPEERGRSQVLHRLRLLEVAGYEQTGGTDLVRRDDLATIVESWRIAWAPDFDARCIEAARYGVTLAEAACNVLAERAAGIERDAGRAALLLLEAALAGLAALAGDLRRRVAELIRGEGDFFGVTGALGHLLYLYRYDTALGTAGTADVGELLREAYNRGLWLLESLGQTAGRDAEVIDGVLALRETFERCGPALRLARDELLAVLQRVGADRGQGPVVRGAAIGGRWSLGATGGDEVRGQIRLFSGPDQLGDFLTGLFALAREQVQRQRDLVLAVHDVLVGYGDDDFLTALPALRLAFTYFTPREKHHLALTLRQALGMEKQPEMAALAVDAGTAARALALEGRLFAACEKFGLRGRAARENHG